MDYNQKTLRIVLLILSISGLSLAIQIPIYGWELWVVPLLLIGILCIWALHIFETVSVNIRIAISVVYMMLTMFFFGIHYNILSRIGINVVLFMLVYSFLNQIYIIRLFYFEYLIIMLIQFLHPSEGSRVGFIGLPVSEVMSHFLMVSFVYIMTIRIIDERLESISLNKQARERIEKSDADMEDFLSNISHELRTPVNVVNGMSDLLIKRNVGYEAASIKTAGIRLATQIEDIQDYTECKRNKMILEESEYMSISLINDVITDFRMNDQKRDLELIVNMDPRIPIRMIGDIKKLHKIFRHLLENAVTYTKRGGIYIHLFTEKTAYGVNLCIEVTDTGIGMSREALDSIADGMFQVNKKRNRSSGGIGLGLFIVYGFTHKMGGFVNMESESGVGTTVRVTLPQKIADHTPCLRLTESFHGAAIFYTIPDKYKVARLRDFHRYMGSTLAAGANVPSYPADSVSDIERLLKKVNITHIFMGQEEYEKDSHYFETLAKKGIHITVTTKREIPTNSKNGITLVSKPLYSYTIVRILNNEWDQNQSELSELHKKPDFTNVRALVVDDEPMNLVVATGLFRNYKMVIDTANSGKEAIQRCESNHYDVIFMDHMMPEMDGIEAMKHIRSNLKGHRTAIVALTANAVSGAREMFIREGFDGFIAKPIDISDFERVMLRVLPTKKDEKG